MSDSATSTPDIFADNPIRHEELDRLVNEQMDHYSDVPEGKTKYTLLLQQIAQHSDNQLDDVYFNVNHARTRMSRCMEIEILSTDQKSG